MTTPTEIADLAVKADWVAGLLRTHPDLPLERYVVEGVVSFTVRGGDDELAMWREIMPPGKEHDHSQESFRRGEWHKSLIGDGWTVHVYHLLPLRHCENCGQVRSWGVAG